MAGNWLFNFFRFVETFFIQGWDAWEILHLESVSWHIWTWFCHPPFADPMLKSSEVYKPTLFFTGVCKYVKVPAPRLDLLHLLAQYFLFSLIGLL